MDKEEKATAEKTEDKVFKRAEAYVRARFNESLDPIYLFHNYAFSEEIADKIVDLAEEADLDEALTKKLRLAALFYPLGYTKGHKKFAERSAAELLAFAKEEGFDAEDAASWITAAPAATAQSPFEVRLLHDAAWSWLGRKRYDRRSNLLQLEREAVEGKVGDPVKFGKEMQDFLLKFNYLTDVGKEEFDSRRRKNVSKQQSNNYKIQQKEVKAKTGKNFGRGIDTMYRTAFRNHINLSRIADDKANMMISINTIILSILIAVSGAGLSFFEELFFEDPEFLAPIIILLISSLTAVIFAVFSARPKVTEYRIKKRKLLESKEASLLYFGNFLKLEKSDFIKYMSKMKMDQDSLYDDLGRDLYDLGQVLHRKYLLLTISYNTFIGGLALAVIIFLTVYIFNLTSFN
ncbi:putative integral membrane protein [Lewinella aquimaris]|uniref:Putative integral membrane protein n=1 Tax=Neolewinella aquimaris TaxID=1835722 RepID=A0A840DWD9_9BACT|nr:Pycsar system effector family protein [Neolewinella aquimaris]MBB4077494.1 putative integral membrane protein [Neolewinella aquimaris]